MKPVGVATNGNRSGRHSREVDEHGGTPRAVNVGGAALPAVLVVAHGTPTRLDDIPAFLSNIRRGRPAPKEVIEEVRRRYEAIGGRSPLLDTTKAQTARLSERLGVDCVVAMRMWEPTARAVLQDLSTKGYDRIVVLPLAPYSAEIYGAYVKRTADALEGEGCVVPALRFAPNWGDEPALIDAWVELVRKALASLDRSRGPIFLVFSAHSLPMRVIEAGDPYPDLVKRTVNALVGRLGSEAPPHLLAFQSQGMTSERWLGPDLASTFRSVKAAGATTVLVVPVGFPTDHVETLYDLDIEAKGIAEDLGLSFARTPCLNLSERLMDALVELVRRSLEG